MDFFLQNKASGTIFKVLDTHVKTLIMENKSLKVEVDFASWQFPFPHRTFSTASEA
jgi:hypothetical protein